MGILPLSRSANLSEAVGMRQGQPCFVFQVGLSDLANYLAIFTIFFSLND